VRRSPRGHWLTEEAGDHVWYVAYGSNLSLARFRCYVAGGQPDGALREYPGCRDPAGPREWRRLEIGGQVYFAGTSTAWGGGMAFYDHNAVGNVYARAYLLTGSQLSDVVAQEMCRETGTDLDLASVASSGRYVFGPGRYETLVQLGNLEGRPMMTFTIEDHVDPPLNPPVAAYLRAMGLGLAEAHGWASSRISDYLSSAPGARGFWSRGEIEALLR
jgi:hypothetical protein